MRVLVGRLVPPWVVRVLGVPLLVVGLLGPWVYEGLRARGHWPEPPRPAAVRPAMVVVPAGSFQMGSPDGEGANDEHPRHAVKLTRRFALSETEVTQENYQRVMGQNPSSFKEGGDLPVEQVSWVDAVRYCNKLSEMEGLEPCYLIKGDAAEWPKRLGCSGYRLPTEAEWEYAARADQSPTYAGSNRLDEVGWYDKNSKGRTQLVASKLPNAWGLYDMSGNVWEWVWDWYEGIYTAAAATDPTGPAGGRNRVNRGGSWIYAAGLARVASRSYDHPGYRVRTLGFRVARSLP